MLVLAVAAVIAAVRAQQDVLGRYTYSIGSNEEATALSGISVRRWKIVIYTLAGLFTGLAGVMISARLGSAQPGTGLGYELQAIAAVVIGGTSLAGGKGSIVGTIIGALIISVLNNGLQIMSIPQEWQNVILGVGDPRRGLRRHGAQARGLKPPEGESTSMFGSKWFGGAAIVAAGARPRASAHAASDDEAIERRVRQPRAAARPASSPTSRSSPRASSTSSGRRSSRAPRRRPKAKGARITFEGPPTEQDIEEQVTMLTNAIQKKPAAIGFAALDCKASAPLMDQAKAQNIPVIAFDSGVESDIPLTTAATDNKAAAAEAAKHMSELIGGKGKVALVVHDQTSLTGIQRRDGFVEWMKANAPDIELLPVQYGGGDQAKSADIAKSIIQANPDVKGIYGANEGSAIGVVKGVEESGKKGITIVGFDSGKAQIDAINSGVDGRRHHPEPRRHGQGARQGRDDGDQRRDPARRRSTPASTGTTRPTSTTRRSRRSSTSDDGRGGSHRGGLPPRIVPGMDELRALRDALLRQREDYDAACAAFAWPAARRVQLGARLVRPVRARERAARSAGGGGRRLVGIR